VRNPTSGANIKISSLLLMLLLVVALLFGCAKPLGKLPIFHAGSLTIPFAEISEEFNKLYPDIEILAEGGGSATTIRKVTELGRECGVVASADYKIIPKLMFPNYTEWYIIFASNQIVLCYTEKSQYQAQVNTDNWYEILLKEGVTYGRSNPDQDPCGYRTLMVWQLAEKYYQVPGIYQKLYGAAGDMMRPKSVDLIALLESGDLDYAFEYSSVAKQHNLKYVVLSEEINLSSEQFKDFYAQARVEIKGKQPGETITLAGEPILYAVTIPNNFPNQELAISWVEFLLSDQGMAIMEANGQRPIKPATTNDISKLPEALKRFVE